MLMHIQNYHGTIALSGYIISVKITDIIIRNPKILGILVMRKNEYFGKSPGKEEQELEFYLYATTVPFALEA